jgi:hypothetical protein
LYNSAYGLPDTSRDLTAQVKTLAAQHREWQIEQPYAANLSRDDAVLMESRNLDKKEQSS